MLNAMANIITNAAHGPGRTCLAFSRDGLYAYTGGADCIVRIWKTDQGSDHEPAVADQADGGVTTVSAGNDFWLSGSEDAEVRRYSKYVSEFVGLVTNTTGVSVQCIAVDPKGGRVVVTSDDLQVMVIDLEDISKHVILTGHNRGVRRATWHPSGTLLTTCGSDGRIIVWDASGDQPKIEKTIEGVIPAVIDNSAPDFVHDCSVVWHPSGKHFYVASLTHEIVTISTETWSKLFAFSDDSVSGVITSLAVSINGIYLASASKSEVLIWSTQTRRLLYRQPSTPDAIVTQLAFSPTKNLLAWTDTGGALTRWRQPIPISLPDPVKSLSASSTTAPLKRKSSSAHLFSDDAVQSTVNDDDVGIGMDVDDDWIIDDIGAMPDETKNRKNGFIKEMVSITKAQPPFQPGSSPMENKKRFLAYNMIGVIEITDQDTHHIVNIEFHDQSARTGYHFTDHLKYDLGYLGERGALFACQPENDHPAQVTYKPYGSWTSQGEWTYQLKRKGLKVLGIASGGLPSKRSLRRLDTEDIQGFGNIVVATSQGDLTFLSGTGRERRIMGLGAEYMSMVAGPEWVFVVHRAGSTTIDGSQNLSFTLFNYEDFSIRQSGILPIMKGHLLKWIGITEEGAPAIYDSSGWLHILPKFRIPMGATWARVMDTNLLERRQGKDESYWPVGVSGSTFMCLILKGRQEYPSFPRPLIQELPIRMPFRRDHDDIAAEENIERETLLVEMLRDALDEELTTQEIMTRELAMDKEFIKLILVACKGDNIPRAIELTKLLHYVSSFDKAIQVAEFYHLVGLREKIEILKADREENEDRLVAARDKRKAWAKPGPPVRRFPETPAAPVLSNPLGDFSKPRPIHRVGFTRATPRYSPTRFTSATASTSANGNGSYELPTSPTTPDGKRRRTEAETPELNDSKRFAFDESDTTSAPAKPIAKSNPFARKPDRQDPFTRKPDLKNVQKSESFFDKVDAVESDVGRGKRSLGGKDKGKEKEKKDGTRQTTLFGLPPCPPNEKKRNRKIAIESVPNKTLISGESLEVSYTQTDVDTSSQTLVETQPTELQETLQTQINVQQRRDFDQEKESSPPIEWPPSPQGMTSEDITSEDIAADLMS